MAIIVITVSLATTGLVTALSSDLSLQANALKCTFKSCTGNCGINPHAPPCCVEPTNDRSCSSCTINSSDCKHCLSLNCQPCTIFQPQKDLLVCKGCPKPINCNGGVTS
jgi:hypothetical protein